MKPSMHSKKRSNYLNKRAQEDELYTTKKENKTLTNAATM
jgi:hypothetical protein